MLRGAEDMVDHLKKATGVKEAGAVSADGLFSYEGVECLGACELAPMLRVDHKYHYLLTDEKIDQLVAERRAPSPLSPTLSPERGEGAGRRAPSPLSPTLSPERGEGAAKPKRAPRKKADG
jgi:hypothetical protein